MAGNKLAQTLAKEALSLSKISRVLPKQGKDWNELLQHTRQQERTRHSGIGWGL